VKQDCSDSASQVANFVSGFRARSTQTNVPVADQKEVMRCHPSAQPAHRLQASRNEDRRMITLIAVFCVPVLIRAR
jgi:hypothetical protein